MMNHKHITISLFRVSTDSEYLDMIFDCPEEYYFNTLLLEVRYFDKVMKSQFFDLSETLFNVNPEDPDNTLDKKHWVIRVPLHKLGIFWPAIYKGTLKAQPILNDSSDDLDECLQPELLPLEDHMICSDVNHAYKCMLNDLLSLQKDPCLEISDEAIRKYLLLYGHQAALAAGDDEVAETYFKLIGNCFNICGPDHCGCCGPIPGGHKHHGHKQSFAHKSNCNCGR